MSVSSIYATTHNLSCVIIFVCILLLTSCSSQNNSVTPKESNQTSQNTKSSSASELRSVSCSTVDANSYIDKSKDILTEWSDAVAVASRTPRISLGSAIADLQRIRRETEKLVVPACTELLHQWLIKMMSNSIDAYLEFLGERTFSSQEKVIESAIAQEVFQDGLDKLKQGMSWNDQAIVATITAKLVPETTPILELTRLSTATSVVATLTPAASAYLQAASAEVSVYLGPSNNFEVVDTLPFGISIAVIGKTRKDEYEWWQIIFPQSPTGLGWIRGDSISFVAGNPTSVATVAPELLPLIPTSTPIP